MKQVTLTVRGVQQVDGDENVVEMTAIGTLRHTAEEWMLEYEEKDEDGLLVNTVLSVDREGIATLERLGPYTNRMTIQRGQRHLCHYDTPFGVLNIGVFGEQVAHNLVEWSGEIFLRYTIDINSVMQSHNEVKISIKENSQCLN